MTVGEKIKKLREEKGLTQKQLGEQCDMRDSQIRRYELGSVSPKIQSLQKIATALGVSYRYFYEEEEITIGQKIKEYRLASGLSQKELGAKLGITQQQVADWENANCSPVIESLQRIASALNAGASMLLATGVEAPKKSNYEKLKEMVEDGPIEIQCGLGVATLCKTNKFEDGYNFKEGSNGRIIVRCL